MHLQISSRTDPCGCRGCCTSSELLILIITAAHNTQRLIEWVNFSDIIVAMLIVLHIYKAVNSNKMMERSENLNHHTVIVKSQ